MWTRCTDRPTPLSVTAQFPWAEGERSVGLDDQDFVTSALAVTVGVGPGRQPLVTVIRHARWARRGAESGELLECDSAFPLQPVNHPVTSNKMCVDPNVYTSAVLPAVTGDTTAFAIVWSSYEVLRLDDAPA